AADTCVYGTTCSFVTTVRRARVAPLFPSPTLFRSGADLRAVHDGVAAIELEGIFKIVEPLAGRLIAAVHDPAIGLQQRCGPEELDRKSTRLNSSHVKTSYAVFFLMKNKLVIVTADS